MFDEIVKSKAATIGLNAISGAALVAASAWFVSNMLTTREVEVPPRIVNSITIEPPILVAGKPFIAHINVTLNKLCPYEVRWSLVRGVDNVEIVRIIEPIMQPSAEIGTMELPPSPRYVPSSVAPGEYKYVSEISDICGQGHTYLTVRKNADVIIR